MMRKRAPCRVIYTVDDDIPGTSLWTVIEMDNRFPDLTYDRSDRLEDAVEHAKRTKKATLYFLDCRIGLSAALMAECTAKLREHRDIDIARFPSGHHDVLRGVYVGALLKVLSPECVVILLTAWYNTIRALEGIDRLLDCACDEIFAKHGMQELIVAIERYT